MDNSVNHTTINSNNSNQNLKATPSEIAKAKYYYNDFVEKMNKSDFCNTSERYMAELAYVKRLEKVYSQNNCQDLLKEISERKTFILEKLKTEFGITYVNQE